MRDAAAPNLADLEARIGHAFVRRDLLVEALTHVSGAPGDGRSYQRLEFLGDRVLGLVVSAMLFDAFPDADEGELSRRLAGLVRKETCAEVAAELDLGRYLRLGPSEIQSGGRSRPAILADASEALIGAVFVDAGFAAAEALVRSAWRDRMLAPRRALRDPKTMLQEWAQGRGRATPVYQEVERSGPAHAPRFVISVSVPGSPPAEGAGSSKRAAEQAAAEALMARHGVGSGP